MNSELASYLLSVTKTKGITHSEKVQELWSGYGEILRVYFQGADPLVVKHIQWPKTLRHPRGWGTNISHQRKIKSYDVELHFYQDHSPHCDMCRVPKLVSAKRLSDGVVLVLEDLNAQGFSRRPDVLTRDDIKSCLRWMARFHACYLEHAPIDLWQTGTYWHLDTRPDEFEALTDAELKIAARKFDRALIDGVPQTFVHGDAKLANFCFGKDFGKNSTDVAAVDFQYVGRGCGMKDLAYFVSSCLDEKACEEYEVWILDNYFEELRIALDRTDHSICFDYLERSWRDVYPLAWADFYRFLEGWSPGHWKIHAYSQKMYRKALAMV